MSKVIPMAADEIAEIVANAGQAGIATKDLFDFARGAVKVGVAWDTAAGETAKRSPS